jgi:hypothetical protein
VTVDDGTPHLRARVLLLAFALAGCVAAWRACA